MPRSSGGSPGCESPTVTTLDREDLQGLVAHGYGRLKVARFVLVRITEPAATRAWLRQVIPAITTSTTNPSQQAFNLAFTAIVD